MSYGINKKIKYISYALELILLYFLQSNPFLFPEIFGVKPALIMAAAAIISLLEEEVPAIFVGFFSGILIDISFGSCFGVFTILMTIFCCAISATKRGRLRINIISGILISSVSSLLLVFFDWFLRYCLMGYNFRFLVLIDRYVPIYLYTVLCLPILYLLNFGIYNSLISFKKTE